jgi:hypothetical protein
MLTAQLPATAAEKTADRDRQAAALRRRLKKIETSQATLMTELEETRADPAAAEYRQRIRDRAAERATCEQQLAELDTQTAAADDPALLAAIPRAAGKFTTAPPEVHYRRHPASHPATARCPPHRQRYGPPSSNRPGQRHLRQHSDFWHPRPPTLWRSMSHRARSRRGSGEAIPHAARPRGEGAPRSSRARRR